MQITTAALSCRALPSGWVFSQAYPGVGRVEVIDVIVVEGELERRVQRHRAAGLWEAGPGLPPVGAAVAGVAPQEGIDVDRVPVLRLRPPVGCRAGVAMQAAGDGEGRAMR